MTPDREQNMRAQLADYSKTEFMDLVVQLQDVIDDHVTEKEAMKRSMDAMSIQIPALREEVERLEALEADGPPTDPDLEAKYNKLAEKYENLRDRFDKVQELNEKFQAKLLDAV